MGDELNMMATAAKQNLRSISTSRQKNMSGRNTLQTNKQSNIHEKTTTDTKTPTTVGLIIPLILIIVTTACAKRIGVWNAGDASPSAPVLFAHAHTQLLRITVE